VGVVGAAWALFLPPLQAPDENSHFGYAQRLAESFDLPGDADRKVFSTEQDLAQDRSNSDQVAGILQTKPEWSEQAYDRWQSDEARLPDSPRCWERPSSWCGAARSWISPSSRSSRWSSWRS
jgi:hypothetical protein